METEPKNSSTLTSVVWPTWLLASGPDMPETLDKIRSYHERFREAVRGGCDYDTVFQGPINAAIDQLVAAQALDSKSGRIRKNFRMTREVEIAQFYDNGSAYRILRALCAAKQMALVHLLDAVTFTLIGGNLLCAQVCLRSLVEHVAHFDSVIFLLRSYSVPSLFDEANKTLWEINSKLAKATRATRIDWLALLRAKDKNELERLKIKYKPAPNREDLSAKTILDAIDSLDKRVKGARVVYEVLCEFAHPNFGLILSLTRSAKPVLDDQGVGWIRKELSLQAPTGFVDEMGIAFSSIFVKVGECLAHFESLLVEPDEQSKKLQQLTQTVVRHVVTKRRDLLSPYVPCPCGSGSKVKFCCGTNKGVR
jgi:hypothetical protein